MKITKNHLRENMKDIQKLKLAEIKLRELERKYDIVPPDEKKKI